MLQRAYLGLARLCRALAHALEKNCNVPQSDAQRQKESNQPRSLGVKELRKHPTKSQMPIGWPWTRLEQLTLTRDFWIVHRRLFKKRWPSIQSKRPKLETW